MELTPPLFYALVRMGLYDTVTIVRSNYPTRYRSHLRDL